MPQAGHLPGTGVAAELLAPLVASVAVDIGAPDYFAVMVLAFVAVTSVLGSSRVRDSRRWRSGCRSAWSGVDPLTGAPRLTFGVPQLADGSDVIIVAVGLFAVGEALWVDTHLRRGPTQVIQRESELAGSLIAGLFIGLVLLVLNLPLAPVWAKLLRIPRPYLYAGICSSPASTRTR